MNMAIETKEMQWTAVISTVPSQFNTPPCEDSQINEVQSIIES